MLKYVRNTALALSTILLLGAAQIDDAAAQFGPACNLREKVLSHLATKYSEAPVAIGVTSSGALLEVLSSNEGITWTVILTRPDGVSCLLAAGEGWRPLPPDQAAAPNDTPT
tara:strand:- start:1636 stop:1971 length:336 start_codon:yes stop_codon:yes gene_type:complete